MNGPQHYREAERLLEFANSPSVRCTAEGDQALESAKVHATLAGVAATIDALPPSEQAVNNAWKSVTS